MSKIDQELTRVQRSGLLPAGVVFTGGGAKLPGIIEAAKKYLRLPAVVSAASSITSVTEKSGDPAFSTAIGLMSWGYIMQEGGSIGSGGGTKVAAGINKISSFSAQIKKIFKNILP